MIRRICSCYLCLALLLSLFLVFGISVSAKMPEASELNGYDNLCLTYTFNTSRADNGRQTVEDLRPYVGYYDNQGNIKDFFFDSYLFLPCVQFGPSGASMHANSNNPTKAIDWTTYVEDTFAEGYNVDALEVAMGNAKYELEQPDKKAGVFFTILYPTRTSTEFGNLGGRELDFSNKDDRKYAIKWIIDEQLRLYNEAGYENLELCGFYWLEEYVMNYSHTIEDIELFNYASDYLHSLGLKFIWIPWYTANGYQYWEYLGIDVACMQPNLFWMSTPDNNRVKDSIELSDEYGLCMEMELDSRVFYSDDHYNRYLTYLEDGMKYGAMDSIKMYYQDGKTGIYYQAFAGKSERHRAVYDLTYKYAKGTLTQNDINNARIGIAPELNVDWFSIGKPYTASGAYTNSTADYHDIDGKELTDGILGNSALGTEWHSYHNSLYDSDGRMSVTVDLEEIRTDITHIAAQFNNCKDFGIGTPNDIKLYISENGTDFTLLAEPELVEYGIYSYIIFETAPVKARYVKMSFLDNGGNFVFCSELLVGKSETQVSEKLLLGDVNGNGRIEASDYAICKRSVLKTYTPDYYNILRGDVNKSGKLDASDYAMIKRHVLKTHVITQ